MSERDESAVVFIFAIQTVNFEVIHQFVAWRFMNYAWIGARRPNQRIALPKAC